MVWPECLPYHRTLLCFNVFFFFINPLRVAVVHVWRQLPIWNVLPKYENACTPGGTNVVFALCFSLLGLLIVSKFDAAWTWCTLGGFVTTALSWTLRQCSYEAHVSHAHRVYCLHRATSHSVLLQWDVLCIDQVIIYLFTHRVQTTLDLNHWLPSFVFHSWKAMREATNVVK